MKHQGARNRTRLSLSLGDEEDKAIAIIKAHYGISSPYDAVRRAIGEHAKQIMEPVKQIMPIRYNH
jgi:hypothetical protein